MNHQIIPPALNPGETIGIVCTARWVDEASLHQAARIIESWGFQVKTGRHVHTKTGQLAGTDEQRAGDLQQMLDDPEVKAILIARGGYGTVRMIDRVNFDGLIHKPKWICGYSDITVLHAKLSRMGLASLHCTMPVSFEDNTQEALESLRLSLIGSVPEVIFTPEWVLGEQFLHATTEGILIGGNLSVLASLLDSAEGAPVPGSVLMLEDVDEQLYHMDRLMMALRRSNMIHGVKALLIGGMTAMKDNTIEFGFKTDNPWGKSMHQMIFEIFGDLPIPVFAGVPVGHIPDNRSVRLGASCKLHWRDGKICLQF